MLIAPDGTNKFSHTIFSTNWSSNFSTKLLIQMFYTIYQQNCPAKFVHLIFQPNLANHFFPHNFQQHFSPTPFTQFPHPTLQHNFSTQFSTKLFYQNIFRFKLLSRPLCQFSLYVAISVCVFVCCPPSSKQCTGPLKPKYAIKNPRMGYYVQKKGLD